MWFGLGMVSLAIFFGHRLFRKLSWAWGWTGVDGDQRVNGQIYKSRFGGRKGNYWLRIAFVCPPGFNFRIKRETKWDRFAKRIGLSVEQQLDDPEFDEHLYLVSDDPMLAAELSKVSELRQVIKALFLDHNMRTLVCEGRHLIAELRINTSTLPMEYIGGAHERLIVTALQEFATALTWIAEINGAQRRDACALRAALMVSLASAILALGVVEVFRIIKFEKADVMLDAVGLFGFASVAAVVVLFFFLSSVAALLRGSSHAHVVMWEVLISGGLGLLMSAYAIARDINCEWDREVATPHLVEVTQKKYKRYGRKGGTYYHVYLRPLDGDMRLPERLRVAQDVYRLAEPGNRLVVHIKPGFLGYSWISKIARP